jgi:hypothetical protein
MAKIVLVKMANDEILKTEKGSGMKSCSMCIFKDVECVDIVAELANVGVGNCDDGIDSGYYGVANE